KDEDEFVARLREPALYWVDDEAAVRAEGERLVKLAEAGEFPFDGTMSEFRPDPLWAAPPDMPAGWGPPRAWGPDSPPAGTRRELGDLGGATWGGVDGQRPRSGRPGVTEGRSAGQDVRMPVELEPTAALVVIDVQKAFDNPALG